MASRTGMRHRLGRFSESVFSMLSVGSIEDKSRSPATRASIVASKMIAILLSLSIILMILSAFLHFISPREIFQSPPKTTGAKQADSPQPMSVYDYPKVLVSESESFNARQSSTVRDDSQSSIVFPPSEDEVTRSNRSESGEEPDARLIILTMNRRTSLTRLLYSLQKANYGEDTVDIDIWIDRPKNGSIDEGVLKASREMEWEQGTKTIRKRTANAGLYQQWIYTWNITAETTEFAVILEDDLEVSPAFYQWLRVARAAYAQDPEVAAFTLQRSTLRPKQKPVSGPLNIPAQHHVFKYRLLGTWGFAPQRDQWVQFRKWFEEKREKKEKPYVDGLITTKWYKDQEVDGFAPNMWSQWWIKFADEKNYFTITAQLPDGTTLASNWRESGLHYSKQKPSADFPVFRGNDEQFVLPENPIHVDWDGSIIKATTAPQGALPQ